MARMTLIRIIAALACFFIAQVQASTENTETVAVLEQTLVELAAESLGAVLTAVADSTRALGDTYRRLVASEGEGSPDRPERWLESRLPQGNITGVRTWPADLDSPPPSQAPYPAFYSYSSDPLSEAVLREFDLFDRLAPTLQSDYESFPFSWVYLTTPHNAMAIFPYVPIEDAVNNGTPTKTAFYQAADFEHGTVGWTEPYLDLVGAGMMVTASYPIQDGDRLLGVASRDMTLRQLTQSVLSRLGRDGRIALIVDEEGLAIDSSDASLADEIERVNTKAGAAVLYYRSAEGLKEVANNQAVASTNDQINTLVEAALTKVGTADKAPVEVDGERAVAAPIDSTEWLLVLIRR